jgi:gliding motility-associated-like protein
MNVRISFCFLLCFFFATVTAAQQTVVKKTASGKYVFFNLDNQTPVNNLLWDSVATFTNGFAIASTDGKFTLVNTHGVPVSPVRYDAVRNFFNNRAAVSNNNKWGIINEKGELVIRVRYDGVEDFDGTKQKILACAQDVCDYFDKNGMLIVDLNNRSNVSPAGSFPPAISNNGNAHLLNAANIACPPNIDFENGNFSNWQTNVGTTYSLNSTNILNLPAGTWLINTNTANRQVLKDRNSVPPGTDFYGGFPVNPPGGGGRYSLKLGNDEDVGTCGGNPCPDSRAEGVRYLVNVPSGTLASNYSITFSYAVVLENPLAAVNLHKDYEQPRFKVTMYDPLSGDTISCANFTFVASGPLPGFDTSTLKKNTDAIIKYKNWSSVYVNLSRYAGRTLNLEFTTGDCTRGGHFGYAYVDVMECGIGATSLYKCSPGNTTLTGPPGFQNYQWYDSSFTNMLGTTQVVSLNPNPAPGTKYWVIATPYSNTGCPVCDCRDTVGVEVNVVYPVADAGPSKEICPNTSVQIGMPASTGYSYQWSPVTNLSNPLVAAPLSNVNASTQYVLKVTDVTTGCSANDTMDVVFHPAPVAAFNLVSDEQCFKGNSFSFSNASNITTGTYNLQWNFGDGTNSSNQSIIHSFLQPGVYPVKLLTVSDFGCRDSTSKNVSVNPDPVLVFGNGKNVTICKGATVQLNVSGAQNYSWNPVQFLSCSNCPNPVASVLSGIITYTVTGVTAIGCSSKDSVRIQVIEPVKIQANSGEICAFNSVKLNATGAVTYSWSPSSGLDKTNISNPVASPSSTITYTVVGYDGFNCFTDTAYATVVVHPNPVINLGSDLDLSTGSKQSLTYSLQNGPITSWLWTPGNLLSCTNCPSPVATIKNDVAYTVYVTNSFGCKGEDNIVIKAFCANTQLYIPNAFTPDGDGINDVLLIQGTGIARIKSFRIFNRWGELLFEKLNFNPNDPAYSWDGKIRGQVGPPDVFVYIAEVVCENGTSYMYKGNVSILK